MRNRRENKFAFLFLILALACFGFDLYHFVHHLHHDPTLWKMEGARIKLAWKIALVLFPILLLIGRKTFGLLAIFTFGFILPAFAGPSREDCLEAREYLTESGMARDAKENLLGKLKITPPRGNFPPEMDKVTWWGTFKPFEFWRSPEFEAVWVNPAGQPVKRSSFRGGQCQLAKTTLKVNELPTRRLEPGMWQVVVSCADSVIDRHPFPVTGSSGGDSKNGIMIWADDVK